jgi:hypothetical protein
VGELEPAAGRLLNSLITYLIFSLLGFTDELSQELLSLQKALFLKIRFGKEQIALPLT